MMDRVACFIAGIAVTRIGIAAGYLFAFEEMIPPKLTCAVRSADGCMVWQHAERVERYKAGLAGLLARTGLKANSVGMEPKAE